MAKASEPGGFDSSPESVAFPGVDGDPGKLAFDNLVLGIGNQKATLAFVPVVAHRIIRKDHPNTL